MNDIWGPKLWYKMHTKSFKYTPDKRKEYIQYYTKDVINLIPCASCRDHYKRLIMHHPIDDFTSNKDSMIKWVIDIHNMVNKDLNKKQLSYDHVIEMYQTNDRQLKNLILSSITLAGLTIVHSVRGLNP